MRSSSGNAAHAVGQRRERPTQARWLALALLAGFTTAVVVLAHGQAEAASQAVYSNDFGAPIGPEWSHGDEEETSPNGERFLGRLSGDESATLNLSGLPAHDRLVVKFDVYVMGSMDGNDTGPGSGGDEGGTPDPDVITFSADGALLKQTTFGNRHDQAFPGDYPGASNPPKTGATATDSLGYSEDTTFPVVLSFPHSASTLAFTAAGNVDDDPDNESWGLDNVSVSAESSPAAPTAPDTNLGGYKKCVKKARRAYRKSLRKAKKLVKAKAKKKAKKRAAKKLRARIRRCRAKFL